MKIKIKNIEGITVLELSSEPTAQHLHALSAGLKKLISEGKKKIILDLVQTTKWTTENADLLLGCHTLCESLNAQLSFVGKGDVIREGTNRMVAPEGGKKIRYFPSVDAAAKASKAAAEPSTEKRASIYANLPLEELKKVLEDVQSRNKILTSKVEAMGAGDLKKLIKENATMTEKISRYTLRIQELKKGLSDKVASSPTEQKIEKVEAYLEDFLKKEGLLRT